MVSKLEKCTDQELEHLHVNGGGEYISYALLHWCKTKGIIIEYSVLHILKHNSVSEQTWRMLHTMKNSLLLNTKLPNVF